MVDGLLRLTFPDGTGTWRLDHARPERDLPALAEFVFDTWQRNRPWALTTYYDYVAEFDDPALPGPDQTATDWYEDLNGYYRFRIDSSGHVTGRWQARPPAGPDLVTVDGRRAFLEAAAEVVSNQRARLGRSPIDAATAPTLTWLTNRIEIAERIAEAAEAMGTTASLDDLAAAGGLGAPESRQHRILTDRSWLPVSLDLVPERIEPSSVGPGLPDLIAHFAPGSTRLFAADDRPNSDQGQWTRYYPAAINDIRNLEARVEGDPIILTRSGAAADIVIERAPYTGEPRLAGWMEHNGVDGSSYWLAIGPQSAEAVETHLTGRVAALCRAGWTIAAGPEPAGPLRVSPEARLASYATAATVAWLDAALSFHPDPAVDEVLHRGLEPNAATLAGEPVDALVWRWALAHVAAGRGEPAALEQRKAVERALGGADPALARAYWRRSAIGPVNEAMALATAQRLGAVPAAHADAAVGTRLADLAGLGGAEVAEVHQRLLDRFRPPPPDPNPAVRVDLVRWPKDLTPSWVIESDLAEHGLQPPPPGPLTVDPWDGEPDTCWFAIDTPRQRWAAFAERAHQGTWAAGVLIPPEHEAYGRPVDDDRWRTIGVHGGITAARRIDPPVPGRDTRAWYVGFDCDHAGDRTPLLPAGPGEHYRDLAFVRDHLVCLALGLDSAGAAGLARVTAWPSRTWQQPPTALSAHADAHEPAPPAFTASTARTHAGHQSHPVHGRRHG